MAGTNRLGELSRRDFLKSAGATAVYASLVGLAGDVPACPPDPPLTHLSATKLARLIADKQVSVVEVVEAHLKRIEEVNPKLNAIVQIDPERVRAEAREADKDLQRGVIRGPVHGVPFTIKDQLLTKGIITTNGCPELKAYVPTEDATVVKRLKDAGGILLGKTNVPEMCYHGITDNVVYGRTDNPYDLSRTPGGSSGGEAAIIAAAGSPFGLGSDIGDSIRAPSHLCGIAGLKPTCRRVPETGLLTAFPITLHDWNSIGPMARYVEDLELVLRIISGPDDQDPYVAPVPLGESAKVSVAGLRVALCLGDGASVPTKETSQAVERAAQALRASGAKLVSQRPPGIDQAQFNMWHLALGAEKYYPERYAQLTGSPLAEHRHVSTESGTKWMEALRTEMNFGPDRRMDDLAVLQRFREDMMRFMADFDAILSPVANHPAGPHPDQQVSSNLTASEGWAVGKAEFGGFCMAHNLTGWPAAVVRAGTSPEGLPIGVQIAAKAWREDVALAVAQVIEDRCGGWQYPEKL